MIATTMQSYLRIREVGYGSMSMQEESTQGCAFFYGNTNINCILSLFLSFINNPHATSNKMATKLGMFSNYCTSSMGIKVMVALIMF